MYFKILKGTKLFDKLMKVDEKRKLAIKAANKILTEIGTQRYVRPADSVGGGIRAFELTVCPDGWKPVMRGRFENCFFPKATAKNKDLLARIEALPIIKSANYAEALKYTPQGVDLKFSICPGIEFKPKVILIDALVEDYKPLKDMIEITEGEYRKLAATKSKK